jgi:hypothetical protein
VKVQEFTLKVVLPIEDDELYGHHDLLNRVYNLGYLRPAPTVTVVSSTLREATEQEDSDFGAYYEED